MKRLNLYLIGIFLAEALSLFAVALFLMFLIQCLRIFDIVSVKGQGLLTLFGQAALSLPSLSLAFLYVCLAIGLGRALRRLQGSNELQIIHSSLLTPRLMGSALSFMALGALAVLLIAHFIEPAANRLLRDWTIHIAADLVGSSLTPHRFTQMSSGVTLVIGGRGSDGKIEQFFADDQRNAEARRTYVAKTAILAQDETGYVLQLKDGALQYLTADGDYAEISFTRYDLALDRLTGATDAPAQASDNDSGSLVEAALRSGSWSSEVMQQLLRRTGEALRVVALCLFVLAIGAFPNGQRRRFDFPIEIVVLGAAFVERGVTAYLPVWGGWTGFSGTLALGLLSGIILLIRWRVFLPVQWRKVPA